MLEAKKHTKIGCNDNWAKWSYCSSFDEISEMNITITTILFCQ